jgi:2-dehydro-3-deoxygluconokinase
MALVTFGEAMVRLTPPGFHRLEQARAFDTHVGGAELNVAVAAARLGTASRWVSRLPDNPLGHLIANRAREQGVDVHADWSTSDRAGLYFAEMGAPPRATSVLYDRAASAMSRIGPGTIDWPSVFRGARWLHVSGITPALSESAAAATAEALIEAKRARLIVSYDLNYRRKLWSAEQARAVQEPLMEYVDVLVTTEEDTRLVLGTSAAKSHEAASAEACEEIALALQKQLDLDAVVITLPVGLHNDCSAVVAAQGKTFRAPRYDIDVVDRFGAGDAFCAGMIVSRLENRGWDDTVRFAAAVSALKHTIPGDFCLVTRAEVDQLVGGTSPRLSR